MDSRGLLDPFNYYSTYGSFAKLLVTSFEIIIEVLYFLSSS